MNPFHLAIPVHDIELARDFYLNTLGCHEGRSDSQWVDFNFFGHQLVCHLDPVAPRQQHSNPVDNHQVPIPHFGVVPNMPEWEKLPPEGTGKNIDCIIQPFCPFNGLSGVHTTLFFIIPPVTPLSIKTLLNVKTQHTTR